MSSGKVPPRRSIVMAARLITALVSLAGAEAVLWFGGYPNWWAMDPALGGAVPEYQADPDLGWRARQGAFNLVWADGSSSGHPFHYTNWSDGRRATSEQEPSSNSARPRILFFGDSYIQGYGLSDFETLPWMVQKRHPELEVSNYGAGLYGTYQSYLAIEKRVHQPASVYYLFNDFHEDRSAGAPSYLRVMKRPPPGWFYPYARMSAGELEGGRSEGEVVWPLSRRLRTVALIQDYYLIAKSYFRVREKRQTTQAILVKMNSSVRSAGGTFTVILFDLDPQERGAYRSFLESQHIRYVDCDEPERRDLKLREPDGQHPTAKLNSLLAEWIEPVVVPPTLQAITRRDPTHAGK